MPTVKKRLDELVADAAERYLRREEVSGWVAGQGDWGENYAAHEYPGVAWEIAGDAAVAARQGDFRRARKLAELTPAYYLSPPRRVRTR